MKWIRYCLMLFGFALTIYGELQDKGEMTFHPTIIYGILLFCIGLMLGSIIEILTGKKNIQTKYKK